MTDGTADTLWCESCGEAEQDCHLKDAGLCGDCFAIAFREQNKGFFWNEPCGHPYHHAGRLVGVCLIECGTEHALDKPIVAQSLRAPTVRNVQLSSVTVTSIEDVEDWDMDGLGR